MKLLRAVFPLLVLFLLTPLVGTDELDDLNEKVIRLYRAERYSEAAPLARRAADMARKRYGADSPFLAVAQNNLGEIYRRLERMDEAAQLFRSAVRIEEKRPDRNQSNLAQYSFNLGTALLRLKKPAEAEPCLLSALDLSEKPSGPKEPPLQNILSALGRLYLAQEKWEKARTFLQREVELRRNTKGVNQADLAAALNNLARISYREGDFRQAGFLLKEALGINQDEWALQSDKKTDGLRGIDFNDLGAVYFSRRLFDQAESQFQEALTCDERTLGADHPRVAEDLKNLGAVYATRQRYPEAQKSFQRALAIDRKNLPSPHATLAEDLVNLGRVAVLDKAYSQAEAWLTEALAMRQLLYPADHHAMGELWNDFGQLHFQKAASILDDASEKDQTRQYQEILDQSQQYFNKGYEILKKAEGANEGDLTLSANYLSYFFERNGQLDQAEEIHNTLLTSCRQRYGNDAPEMVPLLLQHGLFLEKRQRWSQATAQFRRVLTIQERIHGGQHAGLIYPHLLLARSYRKQGDLPMAIFHYDQTLRLTAHCLGDKDAQMAITAEEAADCHQENRQYDTALLLYRQTLAIYETVLGPDSECLADLLERMVRLCRELKRNQEARELLKRAKAIRRRTRF